MTILYDDISKSVVLFVKNAVSTRILATNPTSVVARMNMPDATTAKAITPFCAVRHASSVERYFTLANGSRECYAYLTFVVLILGDTFTMVSSLKNDISSALASSIRVPIYSFAGGDSAGAVVSRGLIASVAEFELPDADIPAREYDSVVFRVRVKTI